MKKGTNACLTPANLLLLVLVALVNDCHLQEVVDTLRDLKSFEYVFLNLFILF